MDVTWTIIICSYMTKRGSFLHGRSILCRRNTNAFIQFSQPTFKKHFCIFCRFTAAGSAGLKITEEQEVNIIQ